MYKEGDAVKKVCNSNTWEETDFVTPFICANSNYDSVDFDVILHTMKSNYANQWFGKVSMQGFVQMIESENRYYGFDYFKKNKKRVSWKFNVLYCDRFEN